MLNEILREGFTSAHRRIALVFVDIFWKALWFVVTALLLGLLVTWMGLKLESVVSGPPGTNPLVALSLARQLWNAYSGDLFMGVAAVIAISLIIWFVLEAYFRSGLFPETHKTFAERVAANFSVFLASNLARTAIMMTTMILVAAITFWPYITTPLAQWAPLWQATRGAAFIGIVLLAAVSFMLTIADTLIRSDAVTLLGTHMLEVVGLIGTLLFFDLCIAVSVGIAVIVGILNASTPLEFLILFVGGSLAAFCVATIHSYLLLVRFFSIGIMKRNVGEV